MYCVLWIANWIGCWKLLLFLTASCATSRLAIRLGAMPLVRYSKAQGSRLEARQVRRPKRLSRVQIHVRVAIGLGRALSVSISCRRGSLMDFARDNNWHRRRWVVLVVALMDSARSICVQNNTITTTNMTNVMQTACNRFGHTRRVPWANFGSSVRFSRLLIPLDVQPTTTIIMHF